MHPFPELVGSFSLFPSLASDPQPTPLSNLSLVPSPKLPRVCWNHRPSHGGGEIGKGKGTHESLSVALRASQRAPNCNQLHVPRWGLCFLEALLHPELCLWWSPGKEESHSSLEKSQVLEARRTEGKSSHLRIGLGPAHCCCSPVLAPLWRVGERKYLSSAKKAVSEAAPGPGDRGLTLRTPSTGRRTKHCQGSFHF